jgi:hypothetical protein
MKLSSADWIYLGPGNLYCAPFVSQFLLYRIKDPDCSLLVYHDHNVSSVADRAKKGAKLVVKSTWRLPKTAHVHFAPSTDIDLHALLAIHPASLDLTGRRSVSRSIGGLKFRLEPWVLEGNGMFNLGVGTGQGYGFEIGNTPYVVQSPLPITSVVSQAPMAGTAQIQCWKATVESIAETRRYDLESICDWSLTAMEMDAKSKPTLELRLVKKAADNQNAHGPTTP